MALLVHILLVAALIATVLAANRTVWGTGGQHRSVLSGDDGSGNLVTGAKERRQWHVVIACSLTFEEITAIYQTLETYYNDTLPCRLFRSTQGSLQTRLVVKCAVSDMTHGLSIAGLLRGGTTLETCRWKVHRDLPVRKRTTQDATNLWHLDDIDQRNLPHNNAYTYQRDGTGITAYLLDTGCVVSHSDFGGRATFGTNYVGDAVDTDCNGHGTFVASNLGGALYGVAKNVTIICHKVLDCTGSGSFSSVDDAIIDIMDAQTSGAFPALVSMSLAGGFYQPINDDLNSLVNDYDVAACAAAGNSGTDACQFSPASAEAVLTVAASTITRGMASFSNRGTCCDIAAPGENIRGANYLTNGSTTESGTSMSCPIACGLVALMMQDSILANGTWSGRNAIAAVKAMATIGLIDDHSDGYGALPLAFSSIGSAPVPQPPPPPPPPPAPPMPPPQSNEAQPFVRPTVNTGGCGGGLFVMFIGQPMFTLFLLALFVS